MPEATHQLAAIMFTDIVEYTALMGTDEDKAMELLRINRKIQKDLIRTHQGTWHKEMGDGTLTSFPTASDAVYCAIDIQKKLMNHPHLKLRIGIHVGEIVLERGDVFGDGVNIASRIESLAPAGGIWISGAVNSNILNKKGIETQFIKEERLKNIQEPVSIYEIAASPKKEQFSTKQKNFVQPHKIKAVRSRKSAEIRKWTIIIVSSAVLFITLKYFINSVDTNPDTTDITTDSSVIKLAILPFNFRGSTDNNYLGTGTMDLISSKLLGVEGVSVLDPNISYTIFENAESRIEQLYNSDYLAKQNVQYLVNGSVVQLGNSFVFTANLWSIDGTFIDKVELQSSDLDSIALSTEIIAKSILQNILKKETPDLSYTGIAATNNLVALNEFLKGEKERRKGSYDLADKHFRLSIEADSSFAIAWLRFWDNSRFFFENNPDELRFVQSQAYDLRFSLPNKTRLYLEAYFKATNGEVINAFTDLESISKNYGDISDVLFLMGDIIYHAHAVLGRSPVESRYYFEKLASLSKPTYEAISHLASFYIQNGEFQKLGSLLDKHPEYENNLANYKILIDLSEYGKEVPIDSLPIRDFYTKYKGTGMYPYRLFEYLDQSDKYPAYYLSNSDSINKYMDWEYVNYLRILGKFKELFEQRPETIINFWSVSQELSFDKSFQPFDDIILDSLVRHIDNIPDRSGFHEFRKAIYGMNLDVDLYFTDAMIFFDSLNQKTQQDYQSGSISEEIFTNQINQVKYHTLTLNIIKSRYDDKNELVLTLIDSIFRDNLIYDYRQIDPLYEGLRHIQAETLLEIGEYELSYDKYKIILEQNWHPDWIAFTKFKVAFLQDKLGMKKEALENYKSFYRLYKDCDEFFQDNVVYANQRIEKLEELNLGPN